MDTLYSQVHPRLRRAAERNVLAHLLKMEAEGKVSARRRTVARRLTAAGLLDHSIRHAWLRRIGVCASATRSSGGIASQMRSRSITIRVGMARSSAIASCMP